MNKESYDFDFLDFSQTKNPLPVEQIKIESKTEKI